MSINVSVEKHENEIVALYITFRDAPVARTVAIEEGACYADEDADGNLIGVELLAPRNIRIHVKDVARHYSAHPEIEGLLNEALETVNV